jgi:1-acyl-sn-glycerol-3-phosphate acyltransferase
VSGVGAPVVPELPALAPRTHHPIARRLARAALRLFGWRVVGAFANESRLVLVAAPHSSGWDAVWGLVAKVAMGVRIEFMAKKELFWWPLGPVLRNLGAIPTDRSAAHGVVGQMGAQLRERENLWLVLAPEGTRRLVKKWKTGFWHIARAADVPVQCAYFHYPEKTIGLGAVFRMTDDLHADVERVRAFYRPFQGKYHGLE